MQSWDEYFDVEAATTEVIKGFGNGDYRKGLARLQAEAAAEAAQSRGEHGKFCAIDPDTGERIYCATTLENKTMKNISKSSVEEPEERAPRQIKWADLVEAFEEFYGEQLQREHEGSPLTREEALLEFVHGEGKKLYQDFLSAGNVRKKASDWESKDGVWREVEAIAKSYRTEAQAQGRRLTDAQSIAEVLSRGGEFGSSLYALTQTAGQWVKVESSKIIKQESAWEKIEKLASEIQATPAGRGLTRQQAIAKALDRKPELYLQYLSEQ